MKIFLNAFILFFVITVLSSCKTLPVPKNGVDAEFPCVDKELSDKRFIIPEHLKQDNYLIAKFKTKEYFVKSIRYDKPVIEYLQESKRIKEEKIDGVLAYYIANSHPKTISKESFDKIKPGLTLMQIIDILGPGYTHPLSSVGFINWRCKDGRVLRIWPRGGAWNKKSKFTIEGKNRSHAIVKKIVIDLISGMKIYDKKVLIICTKNTDQAKAGEPRFYKVNDRISKGSPLPGIEFRIRQIEPDRIFSVYSYEALPEDNMHYRETGVIFIKPGRAVKK